MSENLATILTDSAERHGDKTAVKLDDVEVSYGLLNEGSKGLAGLLREKGVERGDRVGLMLPNVPYFPLIYYGILRAGAVVVPMNVLLKGREVNFYLEDPEAKLMFVWHQVAEAAEAGAKEAAAEAIVVKPGEFDELVQDQDPVQEVADAEADDTAVILYTSGTTGKPKGAELTHANLKTNATLAGRLVDVSEEDIELGALPLFHSFGQTCTMN